MKIKIKFLQINTFRRRPCHDVALATAKELGAGMILMSEPNRNAVRNRKDWICDEDLDTAIKVMDNKITIKRCGQGHSFTYIATPGLTVYNCYSSGNKDLEDLEEILYEIGRLIRLNKEKAIVVGDFNAKSPQWGLQATDRRGQVITEWIAENDLVVINKGNKPTFQRREYSSVLDLTLATADVMNRVTNWEVSDLESLSDHNYIIFEVAEETPPPRQRIIKNEGWQVKKLDRQKLQQVLSESREEASTPSANAFTHTLAQICDQTMPKRRSARRGQPVYWWNEEIASLRRECTRKRRLYTRNARRNDPEENQRLWEEYKDSKKTLQNSIKKAKRDCWKALCDNVDCDIWGDGYKIVMKGLIGYPPRLQMAMQTMEEVVDHLFPIHQQVIFICDRSVIFTNFSIEELRAACGKLKQNKAPGPGNIPPEIIKEVTLNKPEYVLRVYNELASSANFPADWKRARLVLLRKGDKPIDNPAAYRPICLLDVEGKLYEHLILIRLNRELTRTGGLSERQYGFREGRQTVDAINEVMRIARAAEADYSCSHRRLCVVITLDVKNAFNSASWQKILEELRRREIDESLINVIASYLSEREIILEAEDASRIRKINSGVPQGSVLGPTLWNVLYDGLLRLEQPEGVTLIGFADDVAMVVVAKGEEILMNTANIALQRVSNWMEGKGLQLAPEKTEAALLTTKRKIAPICFNIQGTIVSPSRAIKYLGVWLDTKLTFSEQVEKTTQKVEKTIAALASLMPNIGGPRASKRRLLSCVVHSQLLYAAPVWHTVTENQKLQKKISSVQRKINIRICCAYRTISTEGAGVIAGVPPIELLIQERREKYIGVDTVTARANLMNRWQDKWNRGIYGRWTYRLIPNIQAWIGRPYGEVDYFLTQALSGHGCFRRYLYDRRRAETDACEYCGAQDDAEHTLFVCPNWNEVRQLYAREAGRPFNVPNMMADLVSIEENWKCAYKAVRKIIESKERDGR